MDQYIGKMLDNRYEILERIGTGGMAVVYKAKCHRLNRLVAVKILKDDLVQDEDFRRRFNAESQAVAQLSHPNIVSVYDVSRGGDTEYIIMELIDGITLKQYMEKRGQLNWRESLHFITQIMRGLSHAHSRGIVHRDIKPHNIMVLRDGSVRVTDFGIACLENAAQTLTQEALGSVHYISPEQAKGDRTDARSDIYSSGVVFYEMLTGRLPFEGESAVSVAIQHLSAIPLPPREVKKDIPEQLELICMKAMTPDLRKRYPSAEAMIADLEAFRKNPGISLDFELSDLRPQVNDEPTQHLRSVAATASPHRSSVSKEERSPRDLRRQQDEEEVLPRWNRTQMTLVGVAVVMAVAVVALLFRSILASFDTVKAPEQFVVKNVVGMTVDEAQALEGVKDIFRIEVAGERSNEEYEAGQIYRQDPEPDDHRKGKNLVIRVWVSTGESVGEMPNIVNKTETAAKVIMKQLMEKYELTFDTPETQFSDEITKEFIISTTPEAGEPLKKGDVIHLVISKGPERKPVAVPNFVGKNIDTARQELRDIWKLNCTDADFEIVDSDAEGGVIIWQSIPDGTVVQEWDTIQFKVSSGLSPGIREERIYLPDGAHGTVLLEVYVGNQKEPQFSERMDSDDAYANVILTGSGRQQIKVYFNGVLDQNQSRYLQFN